MHKVSVQAIEDRYNSFLSWLWLFRDSGSTRKSQMRFALLKQSFRIVQCLRWLPNFIR